MKEIIMHTPEDTFSLGEQMGKTAKPGQVYCLDGDLGVGKTVFAQGFACGLGIDGPVSSPTFTILQSYEEGRLPLYHFDVYRIDDEEEMEEIGYEDCFYGEGVSLIEWPGRIRDLIPEDAVWIMIEKELLQGENYRRVVVKGNEEADNEGFGN